jgi:copper chaperone CopZ
MRSRRQEIRRLGLPAWVLIGWGAWSSSALAREVTQTWVVNGMRNAADVRDVRDAVAQLTGVTGVEMTQATIRVTFDQRVSERQIAAAVDRTGEYRLMQKENLERFYW